MAENNRVIITLTTDFGTADGYLGIVKGVILGIAPSVRLIDITHDIEPFEIRCGAWVLGNSYKWFPPRTIHLVVVDPAVGSTNQASIIVRSGDDHLFVGPNNGVLTPALRDPSARAHQILNPDFTLVRISNTFHARDVYGPAAAALALGRAIEEAGPRLSLSELAVQPEPRLSISEQGVEGEIVYIDRFGNLITNIPESAALGDLCRIGHTEVPMRATYSSGRAAELVAFVASHGHVEIAATRGSARDRLRASIGARVCIEKSVECKK